ncbi:twin-arginine translocation signal domain-containing protein [Microbispora rosea]|uniref:twin-arginine translocation signal domain-containing protein n=1 Tax=Microbispora rosea TaxID=58117 RepID=UPI00368289AC
MRQPSRRSVLKASVVTLGAIGAGIPLSGPAFAADYNPAPRDPEFPDVEGMRGDRRANELWYTYENVFQYQATAEIIDAYTTIGAVAGGSPERLYPLYQQHRQAGTYPDGFIAQMAPAKDALEYLSRLQLDIYDRFYRHDDNGLTAAFIWFGEGVLFDPRMPYGSRTHMMNVKPGEPPQNWHAWHPIIRATVFLGIDVMRWIEINRLVGIGWTIQSITKPQAGADNPYLDKKSVHNVVKTWRHMSPARMDDMFDNFPYPPGIS